MSVILHITPAAQWLAALEEGAYRGDGRFALPPAATA